MPFGWGRPGPADGDAAQAQELVKQGWRFLDVREPSEFARGHVPGAVLAPLGGLGRQLPRGDRWLVICESGNRSRTATGLLERAGIKAHNVRGGMSSWRRARLPIQTGLK